MMNFMVNAIGKNIIFTNRDEDMNTAVFSFNGPYLLIYPNKKPEKMIEVEVIIEENGSAKMSEELEEIFKLRKMENQVFECIGPYNEDGVLCYTVNVKSIPTDPIKEGALLEKIDWERNNQ